MKRTLVALAALAVTGAFAQSSVSIDGIVDAGIQSINYKGNSVNDIGGNGSSTSQINFRGSEDLGGGLKAEFRVETDLSMVSNAANTGTASSINTVTPTTQVNSTGGTFANGELRVGLAGGFGRVDFGAVNFNSLDTYAVGQPYGTAIGGGFRGVYVTDTSAVSAVRADNAIKYKSPSFSGFDFTLYNVRKNTNANSGTTASATTGLISQQTAFSTTLGAYDHQGVIEVGLNYNNGPLKVSYSQNMQDYASVGTGTTDSTVRTLGGNYDFGAIKLYALTQRVSNSSSSIDRGFTSLALAYTMGAHVISGLYGQGSDSGTAIGAAVRGQTTKMASLGYDYNLSKRSAVYARYERISDDGGMLAAVAALDGTDTVRTRAAIGLRHAF